MRAGKLSERIVLEQPTSVQDATGDPVVTWVPRATVWASVRPIRGREALMAGQLLTAMDTRIIIRWSPTLEAVSTKWRVREETTLYDIVSVVNVDDGDRQIELMCKSGTNTG